MTKPSMPGNPHAEAAQEQPLTDEEALIEATLAVAFESRTQNLIHAAQLADDDTADRMWVDHITPRLGLGDDQ